MKRWSVKKMSYYNEQVTDYGLYETFEDVKLITRGYKFNKELYDLFECTYYTRKNSQYYFDVVEHEA